METKRLHAEDKLAFVQAMYDYCGRTFNAQVRKAFAEKMGVTEKAFSNKIYSQAGFKGQELDLVENLYRQVLGVDEFDRLFREFIERKADGDRRTIEASQNKQIAELTAQNEELYASKLLVG